MEYRESSQIVTLYTREMGKMVVLAKGSRKPKSQFGATLQSLAHIEAIFYHKATRDLQTLSETSHVTLFNRLRGELARMTAGMRVLELVNALVQVEEANDTLFTLLVETLTCLDQTESGYENAWPYFQLRLAGVLGFQPAIERARVEEVSEGGGWLILDNGAVTARESTPERSIQASRTALRAFAVLALADLETVLRMNMEAPVRSDVAALVDRYLRFHLDDALPDRGAKVIEQMRRSSDAL